MVYMNRNGAATLVAENDGAYYATKVASPNNKENFGATTLVVDNNCNPNTTEVASPKRGTER